MKLGFGEVLLAAACFLACSLQCQAIYRSEVISRAQSWVDVPVTYIYSGGNYGGYRQDCSGYVSMCWNTGGPGYSTSSMGQITYGISKDDLKAGDALLCPGSHVALFHQWANDQHSQYWSYEQSAVPGYTVHRINPYPYWSGYGTFTPVRFNSIADDPPPVTPADVWWTATPAQGWYHSDRALTYATSGTNVNIQESPGGSDGVIYLSEAGQGWHDYSVHAWNSRGDVTIHWQGGWDTVAPSTNFSGPATSTWLPAGSSVAWNPTDGTSGVGPTSLGWDNGSTSAQVPEGVHSVTVSATDNATNNVTETHGPYWLDTVRPVIQITDAPATSTWLNTPQTVTWDVSDATSGVASKLLTWDNGGTAITSPTGIPQGKRTATITATDVAGNAATPVVSGSYWIDTLAPVVTLALNPAAPNGENGWYTVNPILSVSAVDPNGADGSGVKDRFFSIDGSEQPYTSAFSVPIGTHTVVGRATDVAGNSGLTNAQVNVDTTAPAFGVMDTPDESGSLDTLAAFWECIDPESGVASYEYSVYHRTGDADELIAGPVVTDQPYASETNLALIRGESYYFVVRAKNNAGLYSGAVESDDIIAREATRDVAPGLNSGGVSAEPRTSDNYKIVDSIGQFVVDTSTSASFIVESGYWHSEVPTIDAPSIPLAKGIDNTKLIQLGSPVKPLVVTVAPFVFADRFYVEQPDRFSGIAVQFGVGLGMSLVPGDRVWIIGTIDNVDGERVIQCAAPTWVSHADPLGALLISQRWLGGPDFNSLTCGIYGGLGVNNIGILIKTVGRVKQIDPNGDYFYVDDATGLRDGTKTGTDPNVGVRITGDGRSYAPNGYVAVTGISSCFADEGGKVRRMVRAVSVLPL